MGIARVNEDLLLLFGNQPSILPQANETCSDSAVRIEGGRRAIHAAFVATWSPICTDLQLTSSSGSAWALGTNVSVRTSLCGK